MNITLFVFLMMVPVVFLLILFGWLMPVSLIISAAAAKVAVMPFDLIGMRLRGVNPHVIVKAASRLKQAGIEPESAKPKNEPEAKQHNQEADIEDEEILELMRLEAADQNPQPLHILEAHHLAGGNPEQLANGLIEAKKRKIELSFNEASVIDLGGGNILRVVAALEEARRRNTELSVKRATEIELASAKNRRE